MGDQVFEETIKACQPGGWTCMLQSESVVKCHVDHVHIRHSTNQQEIPSRLGL